MIRPRRSPADPAQPSFTFVTVTGGATVVTPPPVIKTGRDLRDEALEQVEANSKAEWTAKAWLVVEDLARSGHDFTPDDVWATGLERPREPRALGPIMMRAVRQGLIEPTGAWVNSRQPSQHATPIRVWRGKKPPSMGR